MRRLAAITAFALLLAVPLWAQRGGHGGGFGGHGGFGGGHAGFGGHGSFGGHMGGGRTFGGMPSGRGFAGPHFPSRGLNRGSSFRQPFLHNGFRGDRFRGDRFRGDRFRHHRFRDFDFDDFAFRNCWGWNCGWGWPGWSAGYYDPWWDWWWWDQHSSYDEDRAREMADAREMNEQSLAEQRARREEDQDLYARSDAPSPRPRQETHAEAPTPATVLVFRDQHRQDIQNYAIVGTTLWNFSSPRTQKIALAELDIPATVKANDDRGVDFHVPGAEGQ